MSQPSIYTSKGKAHYDNMTFWLQNGVLWAKENGDSYDPFEVAWDFVEDDLKAIFRHIETLLRAS